MVCETDTEENSVQHILFMRVITGYFGTYFLISMFDCTSIWPRYIHCPDSPNSNSNLHVVWVSQTERAIEATFISVFAMEQFLTVVKKYQLLEHVERKGHKYVTSATQRKTDKDVFVAETAKMCVEDVNPVFDFFYESLSAVMFYGVGAGTHYVGFPRK